MHRPRPLQWRHLPTVVRRCEGRVRRGYLGIAGQSVPLLRRVTRFHKLTQTGAALVTSLESGGPAEGAGIEAGDFIVSFDDLVVESLDDLHRALTEARIGTVVRLGVLRGAERREVAVAIVERQPHPSA